MKDFIKTTIVGGILFLLPVALVLFVLGHALRLALHIVQPISHGLDLDQLGAVAGIGASTLLAGNPAKVQLLASVWIVTARSGAAAR